MEKPVVNHDVDLEVDPKENCTAFCPKCGSDLYYLEHECICKNKECNWTCKGCS